MALNLLVCYLTVSLAVGTKRHKTPVQVLLCQDFWRNTQQMGLSEMQVDWATEISNPLLHDEMKKTAFDLTTKAVRHLCLCHPSRLSRPGLLLGPGSPLPGTQTGREAAKVSSPSPSPDPAREEVFVELEMGLPFFGSCSSYKTLIISRAFQCII